MQSNATPQACNGCDACRELDGTAIVLNDDGYCADCADDHAIIASQIDPDAPRFEVWTYDESGDYMGCCGHQHESFAEATICRKAQTVVAGWANKIVEQPLVKES